MPDSDRTVQCPICDEGFDPTVAGGWCTNPDCGEWQHTDGTETPAATEFAAADDGPEAADLIAEGAAADSPERDTDTPAHDTEATVGASDTESDSSDDVADEDDGTPEAADEDTGPEERSVDLTAEEDATSADAAASTAEETDSPAPTQNEVSDRNVTEDDETGEDLETEPRAEDGTDESEDSEEPATIQCPDCATELDADANFCVECGADVQAVTPGEDDDTLDACPSCDTEVDEDDSFCVNCGEDLDAHRGAATADTTPEAPAANGTAAGVSGSGAAAETMTAQAADDVPERLVLSVEGRDITVEDGDRIGREIRAALLDAGRPEDEAVRIHREHVRFDRQSDGFYLVDLGDNPTRLNGTPLKKGDRELIQPGDDLELSGVVAMTIKAK